MISKKEASTLGRPGTIDLKYINAKEYIAKIDNRNGNIKRLFKYISVSGFFGFTIISIIVLGGMMHFSKTHASEGQNLAFLARFPDENTVIGCYNDRTKKAREASKCTQGGDHNIILPARSQIKEWLKVYNHFEIVNRLGIVNFESGFREYVGNPHAYGYVQTLRKWNIKPEIIPQLTWMKNRQFYQKKKFAANGSRRCGYYWDHDNLKDGFEAGEYGVLSCLYRYHYHSKNGTWYAQRGIVVTKYYKWYMYGYEIK